MVITGYQCYRETCLGMTAEDLRLIEAHLTVILESNI
jgi:hypothetical protein